MPIANRLLVMIRPATLAAILVGCSISPPRSPAASIAPTAGPIAVSRPETPADDKIVEFP